MYYLTDWKQTDNGLTADVPEGTGFLLLAEPRGGEYGLFEVDISFDEVVHAPMERVSYELEDLLNAAKQYAPALALARNQIGRVGGINRAEFSELLSSYLRNHLVTQRRSPYFLARANKTQTGYKYAGAYYWIVGYRPEKVGRVNWVSRDFFVYQDSILDFEVDASFLSERFPLKGA